MFKSEGDSSMKTEFCASLLNKIQIARLNCNIFSCRMNQNNSGEDSIEQDFELTEL